jgi:hypothetical protein
MTWNFSLPIAPLLIIYTSSGHFRSLLALISYTINGATRWDKKQPWMIGRRIIDQMGSFPQSLRRLIIRFSQS